MNILKILKSKIKVAFLASILSLLLISSSAYGVGSEEKVELNVKTFSDVEHSSNSVKLKGRVSGADNIQVWFAISGDRSLPRCESSGQRQAVYGTFDNNNYFYKRINFLKSNKRYEFRACAKNFARDIFSGEIKYFSTERPDYSSVAKAVTTDKTKIRDYSVQFNGKVFVNGTENARVYFLYGKNKDNLDLKTSILEASSDMYFQASVKIESNTKYYFQAVVEDKNNEIVSRGSLKSFRSKRYSGSSNYKEYANEIIEETKIIKYVSATPFKDLIYKKTVPFKDLIYEKTVSSDENKNYNLRVNVVSGDNVYYKLRFVNNSEDKIKDFIFTDIIPQGLELVELNKNISYNDKTRVVTWRINELGSEESIIFILKMKVLNSADKGTIISSTEIESDGKITKTNSVRVIINNGLTIIDSGQGMSIFDSNWLLPDTLLGWLIILVLMLLVAFTISRLLEMGIHSKSEILELEESEDKKMN